MKKVVYHRKTKKKTVTGMEGLNTGDYVCEVFVENQSWLNGKQSVVDHVELEGRCGRGGRAGGGWSKTALSLQDPGVMTESSSEVQREKLALKSGGAV